jgi:hypothetical protein
MNQRHFLAAALISLLPTFAAGTAAEPAVRESTFDGPRAFGYLVKICRIGPRVSGTLGMAEQQALVAEHFHKCGGKVQDQSFDVAHPRTAAPVRMQNIIVSWHPVARERVLLACHYDTRPFPDRDPIDPGGAFIGANDGASGVALLMELAHHLPHVKPTFGVDFVLFDGEELVYRDGDKYFHGSEHFATQYRDHPPDYRYVGGVLVDMIADRNLAVYLEKNSVRYAPQVAHSVWRTARRLGVTEFVAQERYEINDDHIPLNTIAKIPTCDVIDFDYRHWHTTKDLPSSCSAGSLSKVGRVLLQWVQEVPESIRAVKD